MNNWGRPVAATKALWVAQHARANAFGPAHEAYQAFKRVVCDDMGSTSVHYRRLHTPARSAAQAGEAEEADEAEPAEESAPDSAPRFFPPSKYDRDRELAVAVSRSR